LRLTFKPAAAWQSVVGCAIYGRFDIRLRTGRTFLGLCDMWMLAVRPDDSGLFSGVCRVLAVDAAIEARSARANLMSAKAVTAS
jgi:hypothetical protein